jgi:hypothetical protein
MQALEAEDTSDAALLQDGVCLHTRHVESRGPLALRWMAHGSGVGRQSKAV